MSIKQWFLDLWKETELKEKEPEVRPNVKIQDEVWYITTYERLISLDEGWRTQSVIHFEAVSNKGRTINRKVMGSRLSAEQVKWYLDRGIGIKGLES